MKNEPKTADEVTTLKKQIEIKAVINHNKKTISVYNETDDRLIDYIEYGKDKTDEKTRKLVIDFYNGLVGDKK